MAGAEVRIEVLCRQVDVDLEQTSAQEVADGGADDEERLKIGFRDGMSSSPGRYQS